MEKTRYYSYTVFSLQKREILKQDMSKIVYSPTIYRSHSYMASSFSMAPSTWEEIRRFASKLEEALLLITFVCSYSFEMDICVNNYHDDYDVCFAHIGTQRDNSAIQSLIRDAFLTRIREGQTIA